MVDELNPQILGKWLAGMSLPERARTLNRIAHDLTICTRKFEAATQPFKDPAIVIKRLIGLSELQRQLSAQIGHYPPTSGLGVRLPLPAPNLLHRDRDARFVGITTLPPDVIHSSNDVAMR